MWSGSLGEVGHFRHRGLHPVGHLVLGDPGVDLRVERRVVLHLVQLAQAVEHLAAAGGGDARRVVEVEHRLGPGAELDALVHRGEEAVAPEPRVERLIDRVAG